MKFAGITGESQLNGKEGFIELESFGWGVSRSMAAVKAGSRGDADCRVDEAEVTRKLDSSSAALLRESLLGKFDRKVEVHFLRTGPNRLVAYATYEFENCGISSYATRAAGDLPTETLRLNFSKVTFKSFKVTDDLGAVPESAFYDVVQGVGA